MVSGKVLLAEFKVAMVISAGEEKGRVQLAVIPAA